MGLAHSLPRLHFKKFLNVFYLLLKLFSNFVFFAIASMEVPVHIMYRFLKTYGEIFELIFMDCRFLKHHAIIIVSEHQCNTLYSGGTYFLFV